MKSVVVGIDLGTTDSVVAVPGQYPDHGIVFGNVTVLRDESERLTHASAVCKVGDDFAVGDDAKVLASEGFTPVRFVKKYMGTEKRFCVGDEDELPEEISAHVLQYLCGIAEQQLGAKVTGAVITHPAYFDGFAISATKRACSIAGLQLAGLLMEPVAAAMAYCADDERTQLRALIYDLGGRAFDVTLIERNGNTFLPVAFGGNRELGGYNFDKKIATVMLAGLRERGYSIDMAAANPERDSRWATLMHYAERVKMELSAERGSPKATARVPGVFKDDSSPPKSVQLNFAMTRKEFLELIEPEIAQTMRETKKVMEGANLTADDIDYLVLAGGSSRIHAIQQRLRDEFGLDPQFDDDVFDLSVAVGAAMVAAAAGTTEDGVTLDAVPEETHETSVPFSGSVERTEERPEVANLTVTVSGGATGDESTLTSAEGKFYVPAELEPESENELRLSIQDSSGNTFYERTFHVFHSSESEVGLGAAPPKAMLPKSVSVEFAGRMRLVAEAGERLPTRPREMTIAVVLNPGETSLVIRVFQEETHIGEVRFEDIPADVGEGASVTLNVEISDRNELRGTATVKTHDGTVVAEDSMCITCLPIKVPELSELRGEYEMLEFQRAQNELFTRSPEDKARSLGTARKISERIARYFQEQFLDLQEIHRDMIELDRLVNRQSEGMYPHNAEFQAHLKECRNTLAVIGTDSHLGTFHTRLEQIEAVGNHAFRTKSHRKWSIANEHLAQIRKHLEEFQKGAVGTAPKQLSIAEIEEHVGRKIRGQPQAIARITPWIRRIKFGFPREGRPVAVFLFAGPTGTGKTQLAKEMARLVFGDKNALIFIEMAQFHTVDSLSGLIGAPLGYSGCGEGRLTNWLRGRPESVVLFDGIEKTHAKVFDAILRFAEEGMLSDSTGAVIDGRRSIIVMTTNAGQRWLRDHLRNCPEDREDPESLQSLFFKSTMTELAEHGCRPEFLARIDEHITFLPFDLLSCRQILDDVVAREAGKFRDLKGVELEVPQDVRNLLVEKAMDGAMDAGRRAITKVVDEFIIDPAIAWLIDRGEHESDLTTLIASIRGFDVVQMEAV